MKNKCFQNKHYTVEFMELLVKLGIKTVEDLKKFKEEKEQNKEEAQKSR